MKVSHFDSAGNLRMIDVSGKRKTSRLAAAKGLIKMKKETIRLVKSGKLPKGNIFDVAKIAGISAAKKVQFLIPLCHNLNIDHCDIRFGMNDDSIEVSARVRAFDRTGVEMEAMTAACFSLLTLYDMLKPVDKTMVISDIRIVEKRGGKSGIFKRA